ncbi:hypothetical protein A2793_02110 [candidate division WWE3 bacterium RIFCSPHIGHO2_01_FULL_38_45]|nr:MAG: hypothetical protein A2793_02110 [candidate division WWE3 bacterium RIFCSPHIGHO2_01_FULL_38_45]
MVGMMLLYTFPSDPDFGWHYKYGEYIVNKRELLTENIFSYTYTDYKWSNSYWISQIILYSVFKLAGPVLMSLLIGFIISFLIIYLLQKINGPTSLLGKTASALIIFITLSSFQVTIRPLLFSTVFLLFLIYVLIKKEKYVFMLPLLFPLWVNMHADFTLALLILALYFASKTYTELKNKSLKKIELVKRISIYSLCLASTMLNPNGIELWMTLINDAAHFKDYLGISEMLPLNLTVSSVTMINMVYMSSSLILASALISNKLYRINNPSRFDKKFQYWYVASVVIFFIWSIRSVYFFRILVILGVFSVDYLWGNVTVLLLQRINKPFLYTISNFIGSIFFPVLLLFSAELFFKSLDTTLSTDKFCKKTKYPCGAITYLKQNKLEGNMFNHYNFGGFLIWQLPEHKTFIDGRMPSWKNGEGFLFKEYNEIITSPTENYDKLKYLVDKYNIGFILDYKGSKLYKFLIDEKGWKAVYSDEVSAVLIQ